MGSPWEEGKKRWFNDLGTDFGPLYHAFNLPPLLPLLPPHSSMPDRARRKGILTITSTYLHSPSIGDSLGELPWPGLPALVEFGEKTSASGSPFCSVFKIRFVTSRGGGLNLSTKTLQVRKSVCMAPKSCQGNLLDDGGGNELVRVKYYACHSFSSPRPIARHALSDHSHIMS